MSLSVVCVFTPLAPCSQPEGTTQEGTQRPEHEAAAHVVPRGSRGKCSFPSSCHSAQKPGPGSGDAHIQDGYSSISETSLETFPVTNPGVRFHGDSRMPSS